MKKKAETKKYKAPFLKTVKKHWMLLLMLAPALLYVIIFNYIPMTGIVLAFKKYQYAGGIYGSPWNGLSNFKALMISGKLGQVTRNTLLYNIAFIFLGVVCEMGSAILLNELTNKYFKKTAQSFMFLPYFISWVVAGAIMYNIFNYERGVFNHILTWLGLNPFDLYNKPAAWPPVLIFLKLWFRCLSCCNYGTGPGNVRGSGNRRSQRMAENSVSDHSVPETNHDDHGASGYRKYFPRRFRIILPDRKKQRSLTADDGYYRYICIPSVD